MSLEKCPDKTATIEFSLKTTLVSANVAADGLSQMSDALSNYDSGPESEFEFNDFLDDSKNDKKSKLERIRSKINGARTIKPSTDPSKPPLMIGGGKTLTSFKDSQDTEAFLNKNQAE